MLKFRSFAANFHFIKNNLKDYRAEVLAHEDILRSLTQNGRTLVESLDHNCDNNRQAMVERLKHIEQRWQALVQRLDATKQRLDSAQEQWERLTGQLRALLDWIEQRFIPFSRNYQNIFSIWSRELITKIVSNKFHVKIDITARLIYWISAMLAAIWTVSSSKALFAPD